MIPLGLTAKQQQAFERTLTRDHEIRVRVNLLNMDGQFRGRLTQRIIEGQVDVDATAEITRSLSLTLLDPHRTLHFDPESPSEHALYRNRKLRVFYDVWVDDPIIKDWVEVPIFNGPITAFSRQGATVSIQAMGMERQSLGACWAPLELRKGMKKTAAIKTILRERAGVTRFAFPDLPGRLPKGRSLGRRSRPWVVAKKIANSMDPPRQLYFDGRGVCRLRKLPTGKPFFVFRDGNNGALMSEPDESFGHDDWANAVWMVGGMPKGHIKPLEVAVFAQPGHPLSPKALSTTNVPYYQLDYVENGNVRTKKELKRLATKRLARKIQDAVDFTWESLPIPHLDPGDPVRLETEFVHARVRMRRFSIPLTPDGLMSCGYNRKLKYGPVKGGRVWFAPILLGPSQGVNDYWDGILSPSMGTENW